jgi:type III secretory pathway component EscR
MNKNITIAGIILIVGIFIFASFNEAKDSQQKEEQKQVKLEQARVKKEAEKEKSYLKEQDIQNQKCEDTLKRLKGKFNKAVGMIYDDDEALMDILDEAGIKKYKCPNNGHKFERLINKCVRQLN